MQSMTLKSEGVSPEDTAGHLIEVKGASFQQLVRQHTIPVASIERDWHLILVFTPYVEI
jgi:hypothetical protein